VPTHPQALKALADSLSAFVTEYEHEERPPVPIRFPNDEWWLIDTGPVMLIFRRLETRQALLEFRKRFERKNWLPKWSEKYLREVEATLMGEAFTKPAEADVLAAVERAAAILDAEPPENVVVLPIAHLLLSDMELAFPNMVLHTITEGRLAEIRQRYNHILDSSKHTEEEKANLRVIVDETTKLMLNLPCAVVTIRGDKDKVLDDATRAAETVVDFLQFVAAKYEYSFKEIRIRIGGDLVTNQPPTIIMASDGSSIQDIRKRLFEHRFQLEQRHIDEMRIEGFGPLFDALAKPEADRTEFEKVLLRAMHWVADAERQQLPENKTTSYITAIDMFFSTKDEPVTRDVTEGTAVIIGSTLADRTAILAHINKVYDTRSKISHAGDPADREAYVMAKTLALNLIARLSAMSSQFESKQSLRSWLKERRLSS
jgi:hypothetical protein